MQGHQPDILIINPTFGGWFNVDEFKSNYPQASVKCVSLLCSVTDTNLLKGYDESIALYDDIEVLNKKLVDLMNLGEKNNVLIKLTAIKMRWLKHGKMFLQ